MFTLCKTKTPASSDKRSRATLFVCGWFALLGGVAPLLGQSFSVNPSPALGAGGTVTNGIFTIRGSIGQSGASLVPMAGGAFSVTSGYWTFPEIFTPGPPDFLQLIMSSTNLEYGQTAAVPINLASSGGITSLNFNLAWPSGYFATPQLTALDPTIGSESVQINGTNLAIVIQMTPGQVFQNSQPIALLSFSETANQFHSAFVPLPITSVAAVKPNGSHYTNDSVQSATIAVINDSPLLVAEDSVVLGRSLNLYGWTGTNYQLQYSTNLSVWLPYSNYIQNSGVFSVPLNSTNASVFYRIKQP